LVNLRQAERIQQEAQNALTHPAASPQAPQKPQQALPGGYTAITPRCPAITGGSSQSPAGLLGGLPAADACINRFYSELGGVLVRISLSIPHALSLPK